MAMAAESVRDLPQSGGEIIKGCVGRISYTRESDGPFQTGFNAVQVNCQRCGIASVGLGEELLGINVSISEEKMPQETKEFLDWFCGVSRGIIRPRRRDTLSTKSQGQTAQNSILLEKLGLTPRPSEVLNRLLLGQETMQIHKEMGLKIGTVYRYLHRLRDAFEVQTTLQVVTKAHNLGFEIHDPSPGISSQ